MQSDAAQYHDQEHGEYDEQSRDEDLESSGSVRVKVYRVQRLW